MDIRSIVEVLPMAALLQSPAQPSFLDGFLNLRGAPVPVLPLRALFGLPAAEAEVYTPVIVVRPRVRPVAFRVDRVEEVAEVSPGDIRPYTKDDSLNGCAEGQVAPGGRDVVVLSVDRILLRQERAVLEDLQARLGERIENLKGLR
jgi:purine-binding chemotaxis protein CheW